jgi:hypothetical protein
MALPWEQIYYRSGPGVSRHVDAGDGEIFVRGDDAGTDDHAVKYANTHKSNGHRRYISVVTRSSTAISIASDAVVGNFAFSNIII